MNSISSRMTALEPGKSLLFTVKSLSIGLVAFFAGIGSMVFFILDDEQSAQHPLESAPAEPVVMRLPVVTQSAGSGIVRKSFQAQGRLEPLRKALVSIPDSGVISRLQVEEGSLVKAGEVIAVMVPPPEEHIKMARAEEKLVRAEREVARYRRLGKDAPTAILEQQLLKVSDDLVDAQLEVEALREARQRRQIIAPFDGVVTKINGVSGQMVDDGFAVAELHDISRYQLPLDLPEIALQGLSAAEHVGINSVNENKRVDGIISAMPQTIDPQTGTGRVRVEIPSPPHEWRSGGFVLVDFVTDEEEGDVVIPASAIRYQRNRAYTWVAKTDEHGDFLAHRVWIKLGLSDGLQAIISEGLEPGSNVIVTGASGLSHLAPIEINSAHNAP